MEALSPRRCVLAAARLPYGSRSGLRTEVMVEGVVKQHRMVVVLILLALVASGCWPSNVHGMTVTNQLNQALIVEVELAHVDTTTFLAFRLPPRENVLMDRIGVRDVRGGRVTVFDSTCAVIGAVDWPGPDDFGIAVGKGSIVVGPFLANYWGDGPNFGPAEVIDPPPCPTNTAPP